MKSVRYCAFAVGGASRSHPGCTAELVASPGDVPMKARPMRDDCNTDVANRKAESES